MQYALQAIHQGKPWFVTPYSGGNCGGYAQGCAPLWAVCRFPVISFSNPAAPNTSSGLRRLVRTRLFVGKSEEKNRARLGAQVCSPLMARETKVSCSCCQEKRCLKMQLPSHCESLFQK